MMRHGTSVVHGQMKVYTPMYINDKNLPRFAFSLSMLYGVEGERKRLKAYNLLYGFSIMNAPHAPKNNPSASREWTVDRRQAGSRLTTFLRERLGPDATLAAVKNALTHGRCAVNGRVERFGSRKLQQGERVRFIGTLARPAAPDAGPERVLFEDDHLLVYDKPPGVPCQPPKPGVRGDLFTALAASRPGAFLGMVHRLDKDTSGVMVFAKSQAMVDAMDDLFRRRRVEKEYEAVVDGIPAQERGEIISHLKKLSPGEEQGRHGSVRAGGRLAETEYEVVERLRCAALVRFMPRTGRTHQLRVHASEMGHPILGDAMYGEKIAQFPRCLLHARRIRFMHPVTGKPMDISAPRPKDFEDALKSLR
jgi:RluA family pseudouridine synthase